jgi:6-phosphogluconate dehydrogenase
MIRHKTGTQQRETNAEATPLRHPEFYRYDIGMVKVSEVWRRCSAIGSWPLDLIASASRERPELADLPGRVSGSTLHAAIDQGVLAPVISAALCARFSSRGEAEYAGKLPTMRFEFGGHIEKSAG